MYVSKAVRLADEERHYTYVSPPERKPFLYKAGDKVKILLSAPESLSARHVTATVLAVYKRFCVLDVGSYRTCAYKDDIVNRVRITG